MSDLTDSGTLLVSDLPEKALGGIDLLSFTPGPNFRGVKLLPPGFHFIFAGSTDSFSLRHGLWFEVRPPPHYESQVFVAKWDATHEHLVPVSESAELMRSRANIGALWDSSLLSYRQSAPKDQVATSTPETFDDGADWRQMTSYISAPLLSRITSSPNGTAWAWGLTTGSSAKQDEDIIPGLTPRDSAADPSQELHFLPINLQQTWRVGATGRERTDAARDRTWLLNDLAQICHKQDMFEILGELQFCFVMVLALANYSCLEQWKRVLGVVFTCRNAVQEKPELFVETIRTLKLQLKHSEVVDGGLFDMSEDGGALLKGLMRKFRAGLDDVSGVGKADVVDELDEFEDFLRSEFGWEVGGSFLKKGMLQLEDGEEIEAEVSGYEEDDETGEFAPQVVELTPSQKKALSIDDALDDALDAVDAVKAPDPKEDGSDFDDRDLEDMDARY